MSDELNEEREKKHNPEQSKPEPTARYVELSGTPEEVMRNMQNLSKGKMPPEVAQAVHGFVQAMTGEQEKSPVDLEIEANQEALLADIDASPLAEWQKEATSRLVAELTTKLASYCRDGYQEYGRELDELTDVAEFASGLASRYFALGNATRKKHEEKKEEGNG